MIRILIADDHVLIREGFKKLIEREPDISVVAECANAAEVLAAVDGVPCDVLVLDLNLPGKHGLELLADLRKRAPGARSLVLSMYSEEQFGVRALKAGAMGYLTKESASDELLAAIRRINGGRRYLSQALAEKLAFDMGTNGEMKPHERLSNREFQVLRLIGAGGTTGEVADGLVLSVNTVNTYRKRVLEKMGMKNNADIIRYAMENDLVD